ncbi:MAG: SGNH/GDSL hydrolase family protein [Propionibacteriaceae bacterium]|jgi:lysophospholipase L1-like esterase|nr:SGNH/GDSL hydrolase family protein [Propionibacteriaceae bacterium]
MTVATDPKLWSRYVALGDSLTEGLADAVPGQTDRWRGWADRLAVKLAQRAEAAGQPFAYANLAVRGRLLADVCGRQIDQALELAPDLVSLWAGGNDSLRPRVDLDDLAARLDAGVARLRQAGCDVLLATAYNTFDSALLGWTSPRSGQFTERLWEVARRHDCYVVDVWNFPALHDTRMWADDRIHLTSLGHQRMADHALAALGCPVDPAYRQPLPPQPKPNLLRQGLGVAHWANIFLLPWLGRRLTGRSSGDGRVGKRLTLEPIDDLTLG